MTPPDNRRWVLASRPDGKPTQENFRLETEPAREPRDGQILVRNLYLSVDPYMRGRMSDAPSYAKPVDIGGVMVGGTVGRVVTSRAPGFVEGDLVFGYGSWQDYAVLNGNAAGAQQPLRVPHGGDDPPISTALGVCGMPGATAYFGTLKLGKPKAGETLVVSAASGAVGSVVGQIAKMEGCRVVGIAGGPKKCGFCTDELGFDTCIDYQSESDLGAALAKACPEGIDVYFENVGGPVLDAVVPLLNEGSRVPICGFVSQYSSKTPVFPAEQLAEAPHAPESRFFVVWEWPDEYATAVDTLRAWVKAGKLRYREDVVIGLENAPEAFMGLLEGRNFGKRVVEIEKP